MDVNETDIYIRVTELPVSCSTFFKLNKQLLGLVLYVFTIHLHWITPFFDVVLDFHWITPFFDVVLDAVFGDI